MKITVIGFGMLRKYMPPGNTSVEIRHSATVRDLVEKLKGSWGDDFYESVMKENKLAPFIIVLLNGLSINMKEGLDTELNEGDRLVFTIMVNGG